VIKGKDLPQLADGTQGDFYCLVHVAGRKVRTRRVSSTGSAIWNEIFQFRISDTVLRHMKLHVQLLRYSYVDTSHGFAKVPLGEELHGEAKQHWLRFKTGEQVFVETSVISSNPIHGSDGETSFDCTLDSTIDSTRVSTPNLTPKSTPILNSHTEAIPEYSLDGVLGDNELFMEFYEFLNDFRAPPYLQFFMNLDAFRQFTAMELGVDPLVPEAIENYFRTGVLKAGQLEQLKMIKADALDLFQTHFAGGPSARHPIEVNAGLIERLLGELTVSDRVDEAGRFAGGHVIGPNAFQAVHRWIYKVLQDVYFEKFRASPRYTTYVQQPNHPDHVEQMTIATDCGESEVGDEQRSELGDVTSESGGKDIQKISTAIALLKQQLAAIEDRLEASPGGAEMEKGLRAKRDLERQVKSLLALARSIEAGDHHQDMTSEAEDLWLDLRSVSISVRQNEQVFDVEVGNSHSGNVSVVAKAYADFESLHRALTKVFPKLSKVGLPDPSSDLSEALERYLQLLVSDEFIRQSPVLRQFLSLDGDLEARMGLVEAVVGRRVKRALNTATSILSAGILGSSSGSSAGKKERFYETREHHTTSELRDSAGSLAQPSGNLHRSRSTSSFMAGKPMDDSVHPNAAAKSTPPTPVKKRHDLPNPTPNPTSKIFPTPQVFQVEDFSDAQLDMLMESVYAFITEAFDLREPSQWIRRKVLSVSKQLLRQAYGESMSRAVTGWMNGGLQEGPILQHIHGLNLLLWPNGVFIKDVPPPVRSADQQLATQIEARSLFINRIPDAIEKIAGRYNSINGMTRIFNMMQQKDFNKLLFSTLIDITTKILFTEQPK